MFPDYFRFHVAPHIDSFVKWMTVAWGPAFDAFSNTVLSMLLRIEDLLLVIPWWLWLTGVMLISWLQTRRVRYPLALGLLLFSIGVFGLWEVSMETLAIIITAVIISLLLGIPLGIAMAESERFSAVLTPVLDAMQTMPSFVYLIPALMLFGLGKVPGVVATVIYSLPPVVRLTNLGIRQVSADVQEAARAFGATRWQMMRDVRLPLAVPSILAGINQTTMMALAMVVIASMIGAGGLGELVLIATNRINVGDGFEAGWAIVVLAIIIDRLTQGLGKRWETPKT
ncbi:MAG: proline/glycine betaine ABC transporter permease [Syntrophomonadaceae bacterium]|nr:proline/glycine betaine ABC transporter permease [Syntrophomonadaceae bacterium]